MPTQTETYNTLEEIQMRRSQLREAIEQESEQIASEWDKLFNKNEDATKGEYIAALISNSITAIDAFLLVRKLMKTYSGLFNFFKRKDKGEKRKKRS